MSRGVRPRVLLADDHLLVAEALKSLLSVEFELVGVVADGRAMVQASRTLRPEVIVADIGMPHLNGIDAMVQLRKDNPNVKVIFLTMHQEVAYARRALEAGAEGFVLKHSAAAELVSALRAVLDGKRYVTPVLAGELVEAMAREPKAGPATRGTLSPRQREILQLLAEGCSAKQIGQSLGISSRTVEFHKYQMMETLGVHNSAELVHFAIKQGIVVI